MATQYGHIRDDGQIVDFKVDLSVIFLTDRLAKIIADLEPTVGKIAVETSGKCPAPSNTVQSLHVVILRP